MTVKRVLVVDDSRFAAAAIALALGKLGLDVRVARDMWDIERCVAAAQPDLVLMDVVLQEAFGDDVASLLRAVYGVTCPIVLVSCLSDEELAKRSADAGLDGYVSKRGGIDAIDARVRQLVGERARPAPRDLSPLFALESRQRLRRILHVAGARDHWNAAATVGELHALAGDADLSGATAVAAAARACRDVVQARGASAWTADVGAAIDALARAVGDDLAPRRKLLVYDETEAMMDALLEPLDRAGHVVVEARTMAEARQKLRATDYEVIVAHGAEAAIAELRAQAPNARLVATDGASGAELLALVERALEQHRGS